MRPGRSEAGQRGQGSVEWIGLTLLIALAGLGVATALAGHLPGFALARAIAAKLVCAADIGGRCDTVADTELVAEYGPELASRARRAVPMIVYEEGMHALPVDFRHCREDSCSLGAPAGKVLVSAQGEQVTLFVHAIDCRGTAAAAAAAEGFDCAAERAGRVYFQYWAYYPGSQSLRGVPGNPGFHEDDWESVQLRSGPDGMQARASSHHGYNFGPYGNWLSDAGIERRSAWGPDLGQYWVSGGSHAGHVFDPRTAPHRWTPGRRVRLIPVEAIARGPWRHTKFAITPPWRKHVYFDPEAEDTE